jgi:transposase
MDMWDPYVASVSEDLRDGKRKIVYDKFHIAKHLGEGVDRVRRKENRTQRAAGDDRLTGTRYDWLRNPAAMEPANRKAFAELRQSGLKTPRAWALKETVMAFFRLPIRAARAETFSLVAGLGGTQSAAAYAGGGET